MDGKNLVRLCRELPGAQSSPSLVEEARGREDSACTALVSTRHVRDRTAESSSLRAEGGLGDGSETSCPLA